MHHRRTVILIVLLSLFLYSLYSLAASRREKYILCTEIENMQNEYNELTRRCAVLRRTAETVGSDEETERLAREQLGLVYPGEIVFYFLQSDRED